MDRERMDRAQIVLQTVSSDNQDFLMLCEALDFFLDGAIGGREKRQKYIGFNCPETMDVVLIAYVDGKPAGGAALRRYSEKEVEVKRVFVREEYRKRHIGSALLKELIVRAKAMGYQRMILETGAFLEASVCLYRRYGFEQIENYGAYRDMPESLCMGRDILEL